jgi:hypothetical protein
LLGQADLKSADAVVEASVNASAEVLALLNHAHVSNLFMLLTAFVLMASVLPGRIIHVTFSKHPHVLVLLSE